MRTKGIIIEDFVNYKHPSMFISSCFCDWKCCKEQNLSIEVCQNAPLSQEDIRDIDNEAIYEQFANNPITKAVVIGGLEPMMQIDEIVSLISVFRKHKEYCYFVLYTGYYPYEIEFNLETLKNLSSNIIVKFGRYIPDRPSKYDEILGITLASDNQYAKVIS